MSKTEAFTLIELLVSIAIISVLAAILLPVITNARKQATKGDCQSNLHQIGMALHQYIEDNDGVWVSPEAWEKVVFMPNHKPLSCKDTDESKPHKHPMGLVRNSGLPGYAISYALMDFKTGGGLRDALITYPATTVSVTDSAVGMFQKPGPNPYYMAPQVEQQLDHEEKSWLRHNGGANYLFCDGHVKWYKPEAVRPNTMPPYNDGSAPSYVPFSSAPGQN